MRQTIRDVPLSTKQISYSISNYLVFLWNNQEDWSKPKESSLYFATVSLVILVGYGGA